MSQRSSAAATDEHACSIFEYVTPAISGIGGTLKNTPSDFVVSELREDGSEVRLKRRPPTADAPEDDAEYVRFVLRKERVDTFGAIAELSALLGVPSRRFAFAGLKDYHAITTQEIDVRGVAPAQLRRLEVHDRISIGQVRRVARKLKLGQCAGNRFRVALRGAAGGAAAVDAALAAVATNGFVNYFGLQRFGASSRNEEVGRACLQADYEAGVEAILRPQPGRKMSGAELEARAAWAVGRDAVRALRLMPRACTIERDVLQRLASPQSLDGRDHAARCRDAILGLPLGQRRLLAHAYFSRLWNLVASERLRRHGTAPAREGELVLRASSARRARRWPTPRKARLRGAPGRTRKREVHMVTAEEAAAGTYCASRLVLPLPGAAVVLPEDDLGAFYRTALAHEGIEMDDGVWLEVSASRDAEDDDNWLAIQGDYRPLLLRPQRMRWSVEPADDADDAAASDVALRFDLPPGAYATMCLREAIKATPPAPRGGHVRFED